MAMIVEKEAKEGKEKKKPIVKKRTADKWKKKTWHTIFSSKEFGEKEIGTTVAEKPELVFGRRIKVSVRSLAGQAKKQHINIIFKVVDVKGNKAYANAVGHEILDSYLKKFVRYKSSKIETVQTINIANNEKIKIKTVTLTGRKIERKKRLGIRKIMEDKINEAAKGANSQKLISDLVFGNIPQNILNDAKKVANIKRIEIVKSIIIH